MLFINRVATTGAVVMILLAGEPILSAPLYERAATNTITTAKKPTIQKLERTAFLGTGFVIEGPLKIIGNNVCLFRLRSEDWIYNEYTDFFIEFGAFASCSVKIGDRLRCVFVKWYLDPWDPEAKGRVCEMSYSL